MQSNIIQQFSKAVNDAAYSNDLTMLRETILYYRLTELIAEKNTWENLRPRKKTQTEVFEDKQTESSANHKEEKELSIWETDWIGFPATERKIYLTRNYSNSEMPRRNYPMCKWLITVVERAQANDFFSGQNSTGTTL